MLLRIGNYVCKPLKKMSKSQCFVTADRKYFIKQTDQQIYVENETNLLNHIDMYGHMRFHHMRPVIPIYETFKHRQSHYIVYPYLDGFDLQQKKFSINIWMGILNCIKYIHMNNIVHCDLKPENFMYYMNNIYLCDFELGHKLKDNNDKKLINYRFGTLSYIAPEVYNRQFVTLKSDIFSLGRMYYISRTGDYNFDYKNNKWISEDERDIISMMTHKDINKRIDIYDCINYFEYIMC